MADISIPVIDFSSSNRQEKAQQIVAAMETIGFLLLDNVPGHDEQELRKWVDWFWSFSKEKKMSIARRKYNPKNRHVFRGYFGVNQVSSSYKEAFEMGQDLSPGHPELKTGYPMTETNTWPQPDEGEDPKPYEEFRKFMTQFYKVLVDTGTEFMRLICLGFGMNETFFDTLYDSKTLSTLRLINYPVHDFDLPDDAFDTDGKLVSTARHTDTSIVTLVCTFDYEGLQILTEKNEWMDVKPRQCSLIVNLGTLLSRMTGDRLKSTEHRVLAIGRPRQSVAFFFEPSCHAMVPTSLPQNLTSISSATECTDTFEYGPWMVERTQQFVEFKDLFKIIASLEQET